MSNTPEPVSVIILDKKYQFACEPDQRNDLVEAARQLVYHAARLVEAGENSVRSAVRARLQAVQAAVLAADEGIQIHGGYGFTVEYHVERHYRDAMTLQVLDGGAESLLDQLE